MRTYGRVPADSQWTADSNLVTADSFLTVDSSTGPFKWVEIDTDAAGNDDQVWLTTLCQVLLLNLNESPFFATYGIPQYPSVIQQVFPDYYVALTQQAFAPYFASLQVSKVAGRTPSYRINIITHQGVVLNANVPVPI